MSDEEAARRACTSCRARRDRDRSSASTSQRSGGTSRIASTPSASRRQNESGIVHAAREAAADADDRDRLVASRDRGRHARRPRGASAATSVRDEVAPRSPPASGSRTRASSAGARRRAGRARCAARPPSASRGRAPRTAVGADRVGPASASTRATSARTSCERGVGALRAASCRAQLARSRAAFGSGAAAAAPRTSERHSDGTAPPSARLHAGEVERQRARAAAPARASAASSSASAACWRQRRHAARAPSRCAVGGRRAPRPSRLGPRPPREARARQPARRPMRRRARRGTRSPRRRRLTRRAERAGDRREQHEQVEVEVARQLRRGATRPRPSAPARRRNAPAVCSESTPSSSTPAACTTPRSGSSAGIAASTARERLRDRSTSTAAIVTARAERRRARSTSSAAPGVSVAAPAGERRGARTPRPASHRRDVRAEPAEPAGDEHGAVGAQRGARRRRRAGARSRRAAWRWPSRHATSRLVVAHRQLANAASRRRRR